MEQNNEHFYNLLNILSFWIAIMNLEQNIQQSKEQDINKANEKQQKEMLEQIHKEFEEQNSLLHSLEEKINKIHELIGGNSNVM